MKSLKTLYKINSETWGKTSQRPHLIFTLQHLLPHPKQSNKQTEPQVLSYPWFTTNQMSFIQDEQVNILHILSLFPSSWQHIPLLRSAHNYITLKTIRYKLWRKTLTKKIINY